MDTPQQNQDWEARLRQTMQEAEAQPLAEAWDTPSDAVWAGVSAALEEKKRKRLLLLWWWGAGVTVLLLLSGFAFFQYSKSPTIESKSQADKTLPKDQNLHTKPSYSEAQKTIRPSESTVAIVPKFQADKSTIETKSEASTNTLKISKTHISPILPSSIDSAAAVAFSPQTQQDAADAVALFSNLTTLSLAPVESTKTSANTSLSQIKIEPLRSKMQWWVGVYGGPIYTISKVSTSQPASLFFRKQENAEWSLARGLQVKMLSPSGWYGQFGLGVYSIRQSASQVFRLRFNQMQERQLPTGEWESTYALSMPSSYGETEAEIDLRRDDSMPLQEGQIVVVETHSTQVLQYHNYSLGAGFLKSSGRWLYGVGAGLGLNVLQDRAFSLRARSRQAGIRLPQIRIRQALSEASDRSADLQLSGTLGYRFTQQWMLALEPTLHHNLSPVARNSAFSTAATTAGLQLSLNFRFH